MCAQLRVGLSVVLHVCVYISRTDVGVAVAAIFCAKAKTQKDEDNSVGAAAAACDVAAEVFLLRVSRPASGHFHPQPT